MQKKHLFPIIIVFLLFTNIEPLVAQAFGEETGYRREFQTTLQWMPENERIGCDATVVFNLHYYLEDGFQYIYYTANITKRGIVHYEGKRYTKAELGDEAYNAITVSLPTFELDLYDGSQFITKLGFRKVGEYDNPRPRAKNYMMIFEDGYGWVPEKTIPNAEISEAVFKSKTMNIKNVRLTDIETSNYHLVAAYAKQSKSNQEGENNPTSESSTSDGNSNNGGAGYNQSNNESGKSAAELHYQNSLERQREYEKGMQTAVNQLVDIGVSIANDIQQARIRNVNWKNKKISEYLNEMIPLDKECAELYTSNYKAFLVKEKELRNYESLAIDNLNWLIEKEGDSYYRNLKNEISSIRTKRFKQMLEHNTSQLLKNPKGLNNLDLVMEYRNVYFYEVRNFSDYLTLGFIDEERKERTQKVLELNKTKNIFTPLNETIFYLSNNYYDSYYDNKVIDVFLNANIFSKQSILDWTIKARNIINYNEKDDRHLRLLLGDGSNHIYYYGIAVLVNEKEKFISLYQYLNDSDYGYKKTISNKVVKDWVKRDKQIDSINGKVIFEESIKGREDDSSILNARRKILALKNKGDYDKALLLIQKTKKKAPNSYALLVTEANIYMAQGDDKSALETQKRAIVLNPNNPRLYYNVGVFEFKLRNIEEAIGYYKLAIDLKPDYYDALNNIATLYAGSRNNVEAIKYYRKAVNLKPDNFRLNAALGLVYHSQGFSLFRQADKITENMETNDKLIEGVGFLENAMAYYKRALKIDNSDEGLKARIPILQAEIDQANSIILQKN